MKSSRTLGLVRVKPRDPRVGQKVLGHASIETFYRHYVLDEITVDATEGIY